MNESDLLGLCLELTVSEPWDFVTSNGSGPFPARVLQVGSDQTEKIGVLLIQIERPLVYMRVSCEYFIAKPRYQKESILDLLHGSQINCGLTCIPMHRAISANPFDLTWWHGGVTLIGSLRKQTQSAEQ